MKIEITTAKLKEMAQTAYKAIDAKPMVDWMNGILLDASGDMLTATATNGQYTISHSTHTDTASEDVRMLLDGKMLAKIAAKLPNGNCILQSSSDGKRVTLHADGSKTTLALLDADDFKRNPSIVPTISTEINAGKLKQIANGVMYAVSLVDSRQYLTGVLLQKKENRMFAVGLDGFRMGIYRADCTGTGDAKLVVPAKGLGCLLSSLDNDDETIILESDGKAMAVTADDISFHTILLAGEYIDYKKIIPQDAATTIRFDVAQMRGAIERAMLVSSKNQLLKMTVRQDAVTVQSNSETAETVETMELPVQGEDMTVAFNGRYLRDMMVAIGNGEATMKLTGPTMPVLVVPDGEQGAMHVVLPVRIMTQE